MLHKIMDELDTILRWLFWVIAILLGCWSIELTAKAIIRLLRAYGI